MGTHLKMKRIQTSRRRLKARKRAISPSTTSKSTTPKRLPPSGLLRKPRKLPPILHRKSSVKHLPKPKESMRGRINLSSERPKPCKRSTSSMRRVKPLRMQTLSFHQLKSRRQIKNISKRRGRTIMRLSTLGTRGTSSMTMYLSTIAIS